MHPAWGYQRTLPFCNILSNVMTRKTTFSRGQCGGIVGICPPSLVEIARGTSLPRIPWYRSQTRNRSSSLKGVNTIPRAVERGDVRTQSLLHPQFSQRATPPLQFGATQMTKLSINAKRRPRGDTNEGRLTRWFSPFTTPCHCILGSTARGEKEIASIPLKFSAASPIIFKSFNHHSVHPVETNF